MIYDFQLMLVINVWPKFAVLNRGVERVGKVNSTLARD